MQNNYVVIMLGFMVLGWVLMQWLWPLLLKSLRLNNENGNRNENDNDNENENGNENDNDNENDEVLKTTIAITERALKQLNCTWQSDETAPNTKRFTFQAEHFVLGFSDVNCFVSLTDPAWYDFPASDIEQLSKVKNVINDLNWYGTVNVCYTHDSDSDTFNVHSRQYLVAVPELMGNADYLKNALNECFLTHHHFFRMLAEEK